MMWRILVSNKKAADILSLKPRGLSQYKCRLTIIGIPITKIRRSHDHAFLEWKSPAWEDGLDIEMRSCSHNTRRFPGGGQAK